MKTQNELNFENVMDLIKNSGLEREVFMELYRNSSELNEQMSVEDCKEVFMGILKGSDDLNRELFEDLCAEYSTDFDEVMGA